MSGANARFVIAPIQRFVMLPCLREQRPHFAAGVHWIVISYSELKSDSQFSAGHMVASSYFSGTITILDT